MRLDLCTFAEELTMKMQLTYFYKFLFIFLIFQGSNAQSNEFVIDLSNELVVQSHYIVTKTKEAINIDGKATEKAWENAEQTNDFIDIEGVKTSKFRTYVKMLWDDDFLYVYAFLEEPHIWANLYQRDTIIYFNNDFEVFIDPSGDTKTYGEIELNALNTVWDLFLDEPYRTGGKANFQWNLNELKTAVYIDGTINNSHDIDQSWSVEMAIPLTPYVLLKNPPKTYPIEGEQWRINFSRVQWDHDLANGKYDRKKINNKYLPENNWVWSNQNQINMHAPENWGFLQFTSAINAKDVAFIQDPDNAVKQVAYLLFNKERTRKFAAIYAANKQIPLKVKYETEKWLSANFQKTQMGFEFTVNSPFTGKTYGINESGILKEIKSESIEKPFVFATWAHGSEIFNDSIWTSKLTEYRRLGISEVLVGGSPAFLNELVPMAKDYDIKIHAWMWTLNRPNDTIANKHPEWYAVNRAGKNSLEYRAYVDYYQWLSPFHPEAREYIKNNVRKLAAVEGLASIHLDYVRYVDVILGADLQPKYNLVQDNEMPEYDYGYHPIAREGFKQIFGYDPQELEHPELSTEWRQYRLNAITSLVNELVEIAHESNHKMTAAVFPFPEMSRQMVRQAWNDWHLDAAFPMLYQNFYRESVNWIGFATAQGVRDVDFPIYSGLYSPALQNADDLEKAIRLSKENGASGISIFTADGLSDEQKAVFVKLKDEFN